VGELDLERGEWAATIRGRIIHGYRISQLFSLLFADFVRPKKKAITPPIHRLKEGRFPGRRIKA